MSCAWRARRVRPARPLPCARTSTRWRRRSARCRPAGQAYGSHGDPGVGPRRSQAEEFRRPRRRPAEAPGAPGGQRPHPAAGGDARNCAASALLDQWPTTSAGPVHADRIAPVRIAPEGADDPNSAPVNGAVGSGLRLAPGSLHRPSALHTGLDFPADTGTPILAAAGGVAVRRDPSGLRQDVEIDHGNGLVTRYAHLKVFVRKGATSSSVGSWRAGRHHRRSTGPHLHFEVLVERRPQDPARFLAGGCRWLLPPPRRPRTRH